MPFGAALTTEGVRFALWAPTAKSVDLVCGDRRVPMPATGQGWHKLVAAEAKAGQRYGFAIDGGDDLVPDPASRFQEDDLDRRSTITDPCDFAWTDGGWNGRSWNEAVLYEAHLGTATAGGTYAELGDKLQALKDIGITAIELMPLAETSGLRTWGYDGVLPYAPNNCYGSPDDLKRFIDKAHGLGLMVFLDVVYNHFGPSGNFLHLYAKSFFTERHQTPWGAGINFDGREAGEVVREFFIHNALYWIEEFHIDGLRFDAVHAILDDSGTHFLDELAKRIRETFEDRHVHLVLENEHNDAERLARDHDRAIAYDAQWNDDYHHCWHVLLTGEEEGYYSDFGGDTIARLGRCLAEGFVYQGDYSPNLKRKRGMSTEGLPPQAFVSFIQNHDQVGNRAQGERLTLLSDPAHLALARAALLLGPQIPMIFMGDEWGAKTAFQFFVNFEHDASLEDAIRQGRMREFERFTSFSGAVPDPTSIDTFERSKLDWSERDQASCAAVLKDTKTLLDLRTTHVLPLMDSGFVEARYERSGDGGLEVTWRFRDGTLIFVASFAEAPFNRPVAKGESLIWRSAGIDPESGPGLKAWTGMMLKGAAS